MARHRTIKPEFFTSEQLVECSTSARLLFVGMLVFSDDGGNHPAAPMRLKMEVFPGDPYTKDDIAELVDELIEHDLVVMYDVEGEKFWHIPGFKRHQRVDRPTKIYPEPPDPEDSASPRRSIDETSTSPRRAIDEPSEIDRPGVEKSRVEKRRDRSGGSDTCEEVDTCSESSLSVSPERFENRSSHLVSIPIRGGVFSPTAADLARWRSAYPALDVDITLAQCAAWNEANPGRRKTARGIRRHIVAWLSRAAQGAREEPAPGEYGSEYKRASEAILEPPRRLF